MSMIKNLLATIMAAFILCFAAFPATATEQLQLGTNVTVTSAKFAQDPFRVGLSIDGVFTNKQVLSGMIILTGTIDGGSPKIFSWKAFCADPFHDFMLGAYNPGLAATIGSFNSNGGGSPISSTISKRIGHIWDVAAASKSALYQSAAQNAGWLLLDPRISIDYRGNTALQELSEALSLSMVEKETVSSQFRWNDGHGRQWLTQANAVPEPATWAMMIGGFGLVGAKMRRRRPSSGSKLAYVYS